MWGAESSKIGARELVSLVNNLPVGCPLHVALEPDSWHWTDTHELLSMTVESLVDLIDTQIAINVDDEWKRKHNWQPRNLRIPRPYEQKEEVEPGRKMSSIDEIAKFFGGARPRKKGG